TAPATLVLQLKSAFKDGTTHIVMSPLEFMQRLAALVPRPRLHLIRFHRVFGVEPVRRGNVNEIDATAREYPGGISVVFRIWKAFAEPVHVLVIDVRRRGNSKVGILEKLWDLAREAPPRPITPTPKTRSLAAIYSLLSRHGRAWHVGVFD